MPILQEIKTKDVVGRVEHVVERVKLGNQIGNEEQFGKDKQNRQVVVQSHVASQKSVSLFDQQLPSVGEMS